MKSVMWTFVLGVALVLTSPLEAYAKGHGTFRVVKGDVQVKSGKNGKTKKAKIGQKVFPKDTVITGKNSRAKIVMVDKNVLNLSPDSKIEIEAYEFNPEKKKKNVLLNVLYGKVRSKVKQKYDKKGNKFQVKTKSAVAGVRGTDFIVGYKPPQGPGPGATNVVTFEGQVEFGSPAPGGGIANSVNVNAGQMADVSGSGSVSEVKSVPKQQLASLDQESNADTASDSGGKNERQPSNSNSESADKGENSDDKSDNGGSNQDGSSEGGDANTEGENGDQSSDSGDKSDGDGGSKNADNGDSGKAEGGDSKSDGGGDNSGGNKSEGGGNKAEGGKGQGGGNQAGRRGPGGGNRGPASAGGSAGAPAAAEGGAEAGGAGSGRGPASQPGPAVESSSPSPSMDVGSSGPGALPPPPPVEDVAPIIPDFGGPALDPSLNQPVAPDVSEICGQICNETIVDGTARLIITIQN